MTAFIQWIQKLFGAWKPFLVVKPWEVGVRVRLGKTATALHPGFHWRIPLVDDVQAINTRQRIISTSAVTLANGNKGYAAVRSAIVSFSVSDPLTAMMHYTDPEGIVAATAQAEMADRYITPEECQTKLNNLNGIEVNLVRFSEDVEARVYRVLNSYHYARDGHQEKEKY